MILKLTEKHILYGKANDCHKCPIGLMLTEVIGPVEVYENMIYSYGNDFIEMSPDVEEMITEFDWGRGMTPCDLELVENPDKTEKEKPYRILRRIGEEC